MKPDRLLQESLLQEIRESQPDPAAAAEAAARVKARLFPQSTGAPVMSSPIKGCSDFRALIPAWLTGALDPGRRMLLDVHLRECVGCRRVVSEIRSGPHNLIEFRPRKTASRIPAQWAIAATVLLTAGLGYLGYRQFLMPVAGPRATVESIDGTLYKVESAALTPLAPGAELNAADHVRTAKNSTAILRLADGSQIELNQRAEISISENESGATIHLALGNIIVQAAKQRHGTLQVATADCNVSVKGTIFSVNAGTKGSRVAVVEGTVWVDHGSAHDVLHKGDETSTAPDMAPVAVRDEFEWSHDSARYLALLGEFDQLKQQIAKIPSPGLRHDSALLAYLPADLIAVAAVPNVGDTLGEASRIFHERLKQEGPLATWWSQIPAARRANFENTIAELQTAGSYLGNEIVIAGMAGTKPEPVILAQLKRPGLDAYLKSQLPPAVFDGHMRFDNGLFVAASNPADLDRIAEGNGFLESPLYRQLAPHYKQGAGWLVGADLAHMAAAPKLDGARFIVAESRTVGLDTENHASVTFAHNRQGVASWLAAPGPMGSLDFVSPDAAFAASLLLKNPGLIADDIASLTGAKSAELASAFAGEVTIALDGPLLPAPSWRVIAEVNDPERLRGIIARTVDEYNQSPNERTGLLTITQAEENGRTFYRLKSEKLPWEADWTFAGEYWVAAANHELLVRALQNRETGYTLPKSALFRAQLPHDATDDFSAVIYHNLGPTLTPLYNLFGGTSANSRLPQLDMKPGAICFWAAPDRIDAASRGGIFGMKIESILAMQGLGPLQIFRNMVQLPPNKSK
jgi:hypothetical protein